MKRFVAIVCLGVLLVIPGMGVADEGGHSLEQTIVEMAQTPAQHMALADHYRAKAAEARADARNHEGMAKSYMNRKYVESRELSKHCESIARKQNELAAEYDGLAKLHDAEAKKAK